MCNMHVWMIFQVLLLNCIGIKIPNLPKKKLLYFFEQQVSSDRWVSTKVKSGTIYNNSIFNAEHFVYWKGSGMNCAVNLNSGHIKKNIYPCSGAPPSLQGVFFCLGYDLKVFLRTLSLTPLSVSTLLFSLMLWVVDGPSVPSFTIQYCWSCIVCDDVRVWLTDEVAFRVPVVWCEGACGSER